MSLENFYYISQIVASVAVLISLIYLALQQRLTVRSLRAQMHNSRLDQSVRGYLHLSDPAQAAVAVAGELADPSMNDVQCVQFVARQLARFIAVEEQFRQRREGAIDERRWASTEAYLKLTLNAPGVRAVCRMFQRGADKEFAVLLQRLLLEAKGESIPQTVAVWKAIAAQERSEIAATH